MILLITILQVALMGLQPAHPIKMSTCIVTYDQNGETLNLKFFFFKDDFGDHLSHITGQNLDLDKKDKTTSLAMQNYIEQNFNISANTTPLTMLYNGYQLNDLTVEVNYSVKNFKCKDTNGKTSLEIENSLLMDAFDEQTNIMRIDLKGNKNYHTAKFTKKENRQIIQL